MRIISIGMEFYNLDYLVWARMSEGILTLRFDNLTVEVHISGEEASKVFHYLLEKAKVCV